MANSFSASKPEIWGMELQKDLRKTLVSMSIASTDWRDGLYVGYKVHSPYGSRPTMQTYVKGTDITVNDRTTTDDSITISTSQAGGSYYDDLDKAQDIPGWIEREKSGLSHMLSNRMDQAVFANYSSAASTVIDTDVGAANSNNSGYIAMDESNIKSIFIQAGKKLNAKYVPMDGRVASIGPEAYAILEDMYSDRETAKGDAAFENGRTGLMVHGFEVLLNNNNPFSATWTPANNPSEGNTITIGSVTITFTASATSAGDCLIGGTTAATLDNLVAMIDNTGTGDGTDYYEFSEADRHALENMGADATDGTTYLGLVAYGDIYTTASDVGNDPWSAEYSHMIFGRKGAIELIAQKMPTVQEQIAQKRFGKYILAVDLFGTGVWTRKDDELVDVRISADNFS